MAGLHKRNGTWHLRMRVPRRYLDVAGRSEIHRSLRTDSERRARELQPAAEAQILKDLEAMRALTPEMSDTVDQLAAASHIAANEGFLYRPVAELVTAPLDELLGRFAAVERHQGDPKVAKAVLGGVEQTGLRLSQFAAADEQLAAFDNRFKNPNQMRVWRNAKIRAATNLRAALDGADILVEDIDHAVALRHRAWWKRKVAAEGLAIESANKEFANLAGMLRRYYENIARPNPPEPYRKVSLRDRYNDEKRKLEIPTDWIVEKWFAPGAFDNLNAEARDILLISIETGCRQSEIHDLPPEAIVLDAAIPHILVANSDGAHRREIKNLASKRKVPLVGVALAAARRNPDGFPRYRGKGGYSGNVNGRLRTSGLLPTPEHTIGGLRHSWESRMEAYRVSETQRGQMMGHSIKKIRGRPVYGDDVSLEERHKIAKKLSLPVPDHLA